MSNDKGIYFSADQSLWTFGVFNNTDGGHITKFSSSASLPNINNVSPTLTWT